MSQPPKHEEFEISSQAQFDQKSTQSESMKTAHSEPDTHLDTDHDVEIQDDIEIGDLRKNLMKAAQDWKPDAESLVSEADVLESEERAAQNQAQENSELSASGSSDPRKPVTMIHDPFHISTFDISEAQDDPNELDLDQDLDLDLDLETSPEIEAAPLDPAQLEHDLSRLAEAMDVEHKKTLEEAQSWTADTAEDQAQLLAQQIAEDEALQKHLAQEAAEIDEIDPELAAALPKEPTVDANGQLDLRELQSCIESLLFMSDKPMTVAKIQTLLGPDFDVSLFQEAVTALKDRYQDLAHGFELVEVGGGFQFRTKAGRAALAKKLAKVQTQRLSSGGMETLAIIAYRQPAMKEEIDKIRGVDSSHFIRGLLDKKLINISGRSELPGRPMLYSTTQEFLELFGLKDLAAMPSLRELEQMVPSSQSANPEDEDPRVKEMRRLVSEMKNNSTSILDYDPREDEKILKEIRDRVNAIPTTTRTLEEQKEAEKQAHLAAVQAAKGEIPADLFAAAEPVAAHPSTLSEVNAEPPSETDDNEDEPEQTDET